MVQGLAMLEGNFSAIKIQSGLRAHNYVASVELSRAISLSLLLERPLILEGAPGLGKTSVARALSGLLSKSYYHLQCHDELGVDQVLYEWNTLAQLLAVKVDMSAASPNVTGTDSGNGSASYKDVFREEFLLARPLLSSLKDERGGVLCIDELDRANSSIEALLLEFLDNYSISIPELRTIKAVHAPVVLITTNHTRDLSDALKRRCLYHYLDYPSLQEELEIIRLSAAGMLTSLTQEQQAALQHQLVSFVQSLRKKIMAKPMGIAQTLEAYRCLIKLGFIEFNQQAKVELEAVLVKDKDDRAIYWQ